VGCILAHYRFGVIQNFVFYRAFGKKIPKWRLHGPTLEKMDTKIAWGVPFFPLVLRFHHFI
jgi:hypothetical protein